MKTCTVCSEQKALSEFYNRRASHDGKAYRCKDCDNKAVRKFREKHRERFLERQRNSNLLSKYGITHSDYEILLEKQGNVCAICGGGPVNSRPPYNSRLVVDHCHETGVVRGLLCQTCNKALGLLRDSIDNLKSAIKYLQVH